MWSTSVSQSTHRVPFVDSPAQQLNSTGTKNDFILTNRSEINDHSDLVSTFYCRSQCESIKVREQKSSGSCLCRYISILLFLLCMHFSNRVLKMHE